MKTLFRWLVVISTLAYLLLFFMPAMPLQISPDVAALRGKSGYGATIPSLPWFPWLFLLAWLVASIGLLLFRAWARVLFVAVYIVVLLLRFIQGTTVHLPIEGFLGEVVSLMDGAILALAFTDPTASYFKRK
jgi:hypothetical protein